MAPDWVPMRWPGADAKHWHRPEALQLLDSTPINCIIVSWPAESEQQSSLTPLISAARKKGIAVVGHVQSEPPRAAAKAGLSALLAGDEIEADVPVIRAKPASEAQAGTLGIAAISEAAWPRIPVQWRGRTGDAQERAAAAAQAGPTGAPWVDANGWRCLLARAKAPEASLWTMASPPQENTNLRADAYALAVAESAAYGARWVIDLDPGVTGGLARNEASAMEAWREIQKAVRFFDRHRDWSRQPAIARLAVVSNFAGPNRNLAQEVLNLAQRRPLPYRVIDRNRLDALPSTGALLWVDKQPPEGDHRKMSLDFVRGGGLLIGGPALAPLTAALPGSAVLEGRYRLFDAGKGRFAIASKPWADPYVLAMDVHLLMSRREDVLRAWNAGSANVHYTSAPEGGALLQIVNYTARPVGHPMSFYVAGPYRTAKWVTIAEDIPSDLDVTRRRGGAEVYVPPFSVYGAIEFGGRA
jgi:hypothetical protein